MPDGAAIYDAEKWSFWLFCGFTAGDKQNHRFIHNYFLCTKISACFFLRVPCANGELC